MMNYISFSGVSVNKSADDGTTPLFVASQEGHTELVSLLIESGASVNLARDDNASPLFIACHEGHLDVIHILMQVSKRAITFFSNDEIISLVPFTCMTSGHA